MDGTTNVAERYIGLWNEADPVRRRGELALVLTEAATYVDPLGSAEGLDAFNELITAAREQLPGLVFRLAGPVDGHHNVARFTWELGPDPDTEAVFVGTDTVVLAADGRIEAVYGFLDKGPAAA